MNNILEKSIILLIFLVFLYSCKGSAENSQHHSKPPGVNIDLKLNSSAFKEDEEIPGKFTGEGEDISPALKWNKPPEGTKSFVVICDDPDAPAGVWDHWILFNIKPDVTELKEGAVPDGSICGKNSWGRTCYNGPMPPKGQKHRYFFRIYALDILLNFDKTPDKKVILNSMEGHILAFGQLRGIYRR